MHVPLRMPTQARCDRVPPTHAHEFLPVDFRAEDDLPQDPRTWCRSDVGRWVSYRGGLPERFPMNGKALCLMTREMFAARVPHHGDKMYQEFRNRLARALALQELFEKLQMAAKR